MFLDVISLVLSNSDFLFKEKIFIIEARVHGKCGIILTYLALKYFT